MSTTAGSRPPLPLFTAETARQKVRVAEDASSSRDAQRASPAYTVDTVSRNRAEFAVGRAQAQAFLERKSARKRKYRLIKEMSSPTTSGGFPCCAHFHWVRAMACAVAL